jgi:hypothetical protein
LIEQELTRQVAGSEDAPVGEGVMHLRSDPLGLDQAALAQDSQMLADLGLPLTRRLSQLLDSLGSFPEELDQLDSGRIGEHLAEHGLEPIELAPALALVLMHGCASFRAQLYSNTRIF